MRHISKGVRLAAALMALLLPASFAVSAETAQAQRIYTVVSQGNSGQIFKEPQESTFWESPVLRPPFCQRGQGGGGRLDPGGGAAL